jgi:hypothetical protein
MRNPPLALTRRQGDFFGGKCLELGSFPRRLRLTGSFVRLTTVTYEPPQNILNGVGSNLESRRYGFFQD